jgi:hypothetical protein
MSNIKNDIERLEHLERDVPCADGCILSELAFGDCSLPQG